MRNKLKEMKGKAKATNLTLIEIKDKTTKPSKNHIGVCKAELCICKDKNHKIKLSKTPPKFVTCKTRESG